MSELIGSRIKITGIVQGVGFRPFVYNLATRLNLTGWVRNTSAGVDLQVDGERSTLDEFSRALKQDAPPLALIASFEADTCSPNGFSSFEIVHSEPIPGAFQPISPDVGICDDCLRELFDPGNDRYRYPFINCTNCGPRFTIIQDIPYDRPKTTMSPFEMCNFCRSEYEDPSDRRFHAQPVACAECGPRVWLELGVRELGARDGDSQLLTPNSQPPSPVPRHPSRVSEDAIQQTQQLLTNGKVVAIKGLGGFHLACDATNPAAVSELRRRKLRVDKPFALMMPDFETVEQYCFINHAERELLESRQRPIVLLWRRPESKIAQEVAPGQDTLGVMLPYTPLHYLLFAEDRRRKTEDRSPVPRPPSALVMTSGNLSEEPIAYTNEDARERLGELADVFLMHNRDIHIRCDDSVVRVINNQSSVNSSQPIGVKKLTADHRSLYTLRRSRGYATFPILLSGDIPPLLATGPELKNTFCLTKDRYAFLSHHIGNLENYETLLAFEDGIEHFERLFRITPEAIACDMHPNYLATRYAIERSQSTNLPIYHIQHHHAHIAACMAEHGLEGKEPVIGVSFDGSGYGDDGAIWGGEFLLADYKGYHRYAHLAYTPLPGGDKAIREPWRMALSWLNTAGIEWSEDLHPVKYANRKWASGGQRSAVSGLDILHHQLSTNINASPTSSIGRLFDAVSALVGVRQTVNYEAQAAIELESLVDSHVIGAYPLTIGPLETADQRPPTAVMLDPTSMLKQIIADLRAKVSISNIAARFHNGLAQVVVEVCVAMRNTFNTNTVALSGGVWQNITLLHKTLALLEKEGFTILIHEKIPANDGGLSLGQAMIAAHQFE